MNSSFGNLALMWSWAALIKRSISLAQACIRCLVCRLIFPSSGDHHPVARSSWSRHACLLIDKKVNNLMNIQTLDSNLSFRAVKIEGIQQRCTCCWPCDAFLSCSLHICKTLTLAEDVDQSLYLVWSSEIHKPKTFSPCTDSTVSHFPPPVPGTQQAFSWVDPPAPAELIAFLCNFAMQRLSDDNHST